MNLRLRGHKPSRNLSTSFAVAAVMLLFFIVGSGCSAWKSDSVDLGYKIYVPNQSDNTITVLPREKSEKTEIIDLDSSPQFLAKDPGSALVYALLSGTNSITTINSDDDSIDETFVFEVGTPQPQSNRRMIFSRDGQKAYILTSYEPSGLAVMDVSDRSFIRGFNLGSTSMDNYYFNSDGSRLYLTDPSLGRIYVVNTATDARLSDILVPESFSVGQYDPDNGLFYMAETGNQGNVKIFDPVTEIFTQRIDNVVSNIVRIVKSSDGSRLFVLGSDEMAVIKLSDYSIDEIINLDYGSPGDFQYLPDKKYFLIPSTSADLIMVMDPNKYTTEHVIDTGRSPGELLIIQ